MKKYIFLFLLMVSFKQQLFAQTIITRDPEIDKMVKEVSADSLQAYINKMISYGTRNTLSIQSNPTRGIGSARDWVLNKFNEFAKQSGGTYSGRRQNRNDGFKCQCVLLF